MQPASRCRRFRPEASNSDWGARAQNESGGVFRRRRQYSTVFGLSLELGRNVVEGRAQLRTDAGHRANRRNGDESSDQTVFDGRRTLLVLNQLEKLAHGLAPWFQRGFDASSCS